MMFLKGEMMTGGEEEADEMVEEDDVALLMVQT